MKLQSLQLYDFRSYETASVQLHPGVNLIVLILPSPCLGA